MKRRDFFKDIPFLFITPVATIGMLENRLDKEKARLSSVYVLQNGIWAEWEWPEIKKGMRLKFGHCKEKTFAAVSNGYRNKENIFAVDVTEKS